MEHLMSFAPFKPLSKRALLSLVSQLKIDRLHISLWYFTDQGYFFH